MIKEIATNLYYVGGALALLLTGIRLLYGWFKDFDNASRFTRDMATIHLPYIYTTLHKIAEKLDIESDLPPLIHFSDVTQARP